MIERNVENHSEPEKDRENKTQFASGFIIAAFGFKMIIFAATNFIKHDKVCQNLEKVC